MVFQRRTYILIFLIMISLGLVLSSTEAFSFETSSSDYNITGVLDSGQGRTYSPNYLFSQTSLGEAVGIQIQPIMKYLWDL